LVVWVVLYEMMERLTYYTVSNNAVHYIRGFLGMGTASTSQLKSAFSFIGYGSALFWGIIADTVLGRKRTLLIIGSCYAAFVVLMMVSSLPTLTHHVELGTGQEPIMAGKVLYFLSFFGIALCMGGIKANVASIGADQFDETIPSHMYWRRVFFTWFFIMIQSGGIIGGFFSGPMQAPDPLTVGYTIGYGVAAACMIGAVTIFAIIYKRLYSPPIKALSIGQSLQALCAALGQKITCRPVSPDAIGFGEREAEKFRLNQGSSQMEKGEPKTAKTPTTGHTEPEGVHDETGLDLLCADEHNWMMDRVGPKYGPKCAADAFQLSRVVPLWIALLATALVYDVSQGVAVLQGQQMLSPNEYYNSTFQNSIFDPVICLFYMTLILYVVHPLSKRIGWELTPPRRIVLSTVSAAIGCLIGALIEIYRKKAPIALDAAGNPVLNSDGLPVHDISIFWQLLFYNFTSLMQALAWPAGVEFFYTQMPEDFKSIGQGIFQFCLGIASAIDILVEQIGHELGWLTDDLDEGNLQNYYFTIMTIGFIATLYGMYALYLYKKSGGDYPAKCGLDLDQIEAEHQSDKIVASAADNESERGHPAKL